MGLRNRLYECRIATAMLFIHVGFSNYVAANRIIRITSPDSIPIKRMMSECKRRGAIIDTTNGRRTRSVLFVDNGHIVLTAIRPEVIEERTS